MRPEPKSSDAGQEESLLIEAISLLVQRQREMEAWIAEQVWQAEERTATTERRYTELEARLGGIEDQLTRLMREFEPAGSAVADERLARLREQVEELKSAGDARPASSEPRASLPSPIPPPTPRASDTQRSGVSNLFGTTPADRFGSVLIGIGVLAVVYAVLSQLAFR